MMRETAPRLVLTFISVPWEAAPIFVLGLSFNMAKSMGVLEYPETLPATPLISVIKRPSIYAPPVYGIHMHMHDSPDCYRDILH